MLEDERSWGRRAWVEPDRAHDPIAKNELLVARYQQARSEARVSVRLAA